MWRISCIPFPRSVCPYSKKTDFQIQLPLPWPGRPGGGWQGSPPRDSHIFLSSHNSLFHIKQTFIHLNQPKGTKEIREGVSCIKYEKVVLINDTQKSYCSEGKQQPYKVIILSTWQRRWRTKVTCPSYKASKIGVDGTWTLILWF